MTVIRNKKYEVAAVLLVERLAPMTGVQAVHPQITADTAYGGG
jgi:hypothetical protein